MPTSVPHVLLSFLGLTLWLFILTAIFVPLERFFGQVSQPTLRPNLMKDLAYYYASGLIPSFFFAWPLGFIAFVSRDLLPYSYFAWVSGLPLAIQIIVGLTIAEFGFYWAHRAMHQVPALWRFHAIHHEPERMDWLINTRAHPADLIFTRMCGLALSVASGFGSPGSGSGSIIPLLVLFAGTVWGFFIHSNVGWKLGWLEYLISAPRFHHWHHSREDHPNHNYASMLPVYDRIFGTYHLPDKQWPPSYGIAPHNRPVALNFEEGAHTVDANP